MTQRVFDVENEKDVADLWNILPDDATKIIKILFWKKQSFGCKVFIEGEENFGYNLECININWHDKTEITRPKNFESMIGCVGWFSSHKDEKKDDMIFGILDKYNKNDNLGRCFYCHCDTWYKYFFPAKKCDVKFYGVDKDE